MSAHETLLEHLSPRQRADYEKLGAFKVRGSGWFGRVYWLSRHLKAVDSTFGASFWGDGVGVWDGHIGVEDRLLALKLLIESNERLFRKRACRVR